MNRELRKSIAKLHLWIGLPTGAVVFIVCVTGCLYAFKEELQLIAQPWRTVKMQQQEILLPSEVLAASAVEMGGLTPTAITYGEATDALRVDYYQPHIGTSSLYLNPYSGEALQVWEAARFDPFDFAIRGHRSLWLPRQVGRPIVGYSVLLFLLALLSGVALWYPNRGWTWKTVRRKFTIKRPPTLRSLNFSLHTVVGIYAVVPLVVGCLTGLIFSLSWFSEVVYRATSGGKALIPYTLPGSDSSGANTGEGIPLDRLYLRMRAEAPDAATLYFALPSTPDGSFRVSVVHERGSYYKTDNLFFHQRSLAPLTGTGPYAGKYREARGADQLRRMNLDLHDGRIWGIWGRIMMFTASLIGALLPVTGAVIWLRRVRRSR